MAQSGKGRLNYCCPSCFRRDIDMDMFYDASKDEYYCLRCGYVGTEEEVIKFNEETKEKYKDMNKRVVSFNDDDKPLTFKEHKKGEF
jgi:Zn ribbon nucleic-acid-binding protein